MKSLIHSRLEATAGVWMDIVGGEARAFAGAGVPESSARPGLPCRAGAKPYLIFYALNILQYIFSNTPLPLSTFY